MNKSFLYYKTKVLIVGRYREGSQAKRGPTLLGS
jgi:hypothetical protein